MASVSSCVVDDAVDPTSYRNHLSDIARTGRLVALLGSGISIWKPSNLPAGQEITKALAEKLVPFSIAPISVMRNLIERSAFEHIMFRYPKLDKLKMVFSEVFDAAPPNGIHESFARLIDRGVIEHVITTNYDSGLERACASICRPSRMPQAIVTDHDVKTMDRMRPVIFKIHGCASPGKSNSIISNYEEEGELDPWKRDLLAELMNARDLMVCGYSGYDFEICPQLIALRPNNVHWNSFRNPDLNEGALTANARRVIEEAKRSTIIVGDMSKMLSVLDRPVTVTRESVSGEHFVAKLVNALLENEPDDWQFDLWRIWVMNGTGCSVDGISIGNEMIRKSAASKQRLMASHSAVAEPLFHGGFYNQSAANYESAGVIAAEVGDTEQLIRAQVNVAECQRAAGKWLRAWMRLRKISELPSSLADEDRQKRMVGFVALKKVLVLQQVYRIFEQIGLTLVTAAIRRVARRELRLVADASRKGSWFDFQHCEMLARRFSIAMDDIYQGPLAPMPSRLGFKQLGYFIGEMSALKDEILKPETRVDSSIFRNIDIAEAIGCNPVVWKLSRAVARKVNRADLPAGFKARWRKAWWACEYTLFMRIFLATVGRRW